MIFWINDNFKYSSKVHNYVEQYFKGMIGKTSITKTIRLSLLDQVRFNLCTLSFVCLFFKMGIIQREHSGMPSFHLEEIFTVKLQPSQMGL